MMYNQDFGIIFSHPGRKVAAYPEPGRGVSTKNTGFPRVVFEHFPFCRPGFFVYFSKFISLWRISRLRWAFRHIYHTIPRMKIAGRVWFWVKMATGLLGAILLTYLLIGVVLSLWPVPPKYTFKGSRPVEIYIVSNGIHADFTVPFHNALQDWLYVIDLKDYGNASKPSFISFGWGDAGFFLETPTWSHLKVSNVLRAVLWDTPSLVHVSLVYGTPRPGPHVRKVALTAVQYQMLTQYILKTFERDDQNRVQLLDHPGYGPHDRFYRSPLHYNGIQTCNVWVNQGLKKIGVPTAVWSPFDWGIFYHLPKETR